MAYCIVIPKKGKPTYNDPKAYRAISLLSCFGKLLETLVAKRLAQAALTSGATSHSQMGAQSDNSAIDALLRTITPIVMPSASTPTRPSPAPNPSDQSC